MSSFHERQKSLFNTLKSAEEQYSFSKANKLLTSQDYSVVDRQTYRKLKREMKQFRGRESIFKRPEANIRECLRAKTVPDYIKNPQKWVYYSLSDVTPDQMSDRTNTATAVAFIREMEEREMVESKMEHDGENETGVFKKPTFCISATINKKSEKNSEKAILRSNKIVMPEYVVGMSEKKDRKIKLTKKTKDKTVLVKKAELKLDHLYEDE